ncbi:hypothetical protein [Streptomyces mirabilis]|uniref:hypothetical protein n=1 Tax=Streptomyces mirabilis TaxID=68239 RepID=UPI0036DCCA10
MTDASTCPVVFADGVKCSRRIARRGWCHPCATWQDRHGGLDPNGRRSVPKRARAEVLAAALAIPPNAEGCRINDGRFAADADGYPTVKIQRRMTRVTRLVLEDKLGRPLGVDMFACHRCDNPACVNSGCLWEGDAAANLHDSMAKGRKPTGAVASRSKPTLKIEDADVPVIRALAAGGTPQKVITAQFGVSQPRISRIVNRKRRAWVE